MDKYDILLVRVCKANLSPEETVRRLIRIWRLRCALPSGYNKNSCITYTISHLWKIIEKYEIKKLTEVLYKLDRLWDGWYEDYPVDDRLKWLLGEAVSELACSRIDKFDNFISPAYFRNQEK
jgi:hypothetical protein